MIDSMNLPALSMPSLCLDSFARDRLGSEPRPAHHQLDRWYLMAFPDIHAGPASR